MRGISAESPQPVKADLGPRLPQWPAVKQVFSIPRASDNPPPPVRQIGREVSRAGEKIRFVLFRVSYDPDGRKGQNTNSEGPSINHAAITGTGPRRRWWPRRAFCELEMFPSIVGRPTFPPRSWHRTARSSLYEVAKCTHYPPPRPLLNTIILSPLPTFPFPSESSSPLSSDVDTSLHLLL